MVLAEVAGLLDRLTHENPTERIPTEAGARDELNAMAESLNTMADHRATFVHWWQASMKEAIALRDLHAEGSDKDRLEAADELRAAAISKVQQLNAISGQPLCQFPPATHRGDGFAIPEPRGIGRGVLAEDKIYFPTRDAIYVFKQAPRKLSRGWEPEHTRAPIDLRARNVEAGNLVVVGQYLLIAGGEELVVFATTNSAAPPATPPPTP